LGIVRLLTGAQARWYGCPPKAEQRIYFANHQSHADLVMIWAALPEELRSITRPIAARDYWANTPVKRWITTEVFNAVYVERAATAPAAPTATAGKPRGAPGCGCRPRRRIAGRTHRAVDGTAAADDAAFRRHTRRGGERGAGAARSSRSAATSSATAQPPPATQAEPRLRRRPARRRSARPSGRSLRSGDSIIIFPEGTRGHTGEPQKFKSGLYTLATMFPDVVLVPAWIDNVQRVMPKGEIVPVPILCSVTFGAPSASRKAKSAAPSSTAHAPP
jgi:1-acyl-sn-glycerol-3-phosphate acyltransferase